MSGRIIITVQYELFLASYICLAVSFIIWQYELFLAASSVLLCTRSYFWQCQLLLHNMSYVWPCHLLLCYKSYFDSVIYYYVLEAISCCVVYCCAM